MTAAPRRHLLLAIATLTLPSAAMGLARADEIAVEDTWYRDVTIQAVENGKMEYINGAGTRIVVDLKKVRGIKVRAYPNVADIHAALDKGNDAAARKLLLAAKTGDYPPWLHHWLTYQRMRAAARLGEPVDVVNALLELSRHQADAFYLADPPVDVLDSAKANTLRDLRARLTAALRLGKIDVPAADAIKAMLARAQVKAKTDTQTGRSPQPTDSPITIKSALEKTGQQDRVTDLLRAGQYQQAMALADRQLKLSSRHMARRFYQRGLARLALAEKSNDLNGYKSAALDFMRVVIYFPKHNSYVGASLIEAGYVHMQIGRPDLAAGLFDRAELFITDDNDPQLTSRLRQLRQQLPQDGTYH